MIIKCDKKDVDAIQWCCALNDLLCNVFTIENNELMVQVQIMNVDGSDLRPEYAWYVSKMAQIKIEQNFYIAKKV